MKSRKTALLKCWAIFLVGTLSCNYNSSQPVTSNITTATSEVIHTTRSEASNTHLVVLGIAQDAGYPQADCKKSCCSEVWTDLSKRKHVSCLGVRDPETKKVYLFDATPDLKDQLQILKNSSDDEYDLGGVFITHAHIGHYTGLMQLGREVFNANYVPTYVMPRMSAFLSNNGPWDNLVKNGNINLQLMEDGKQITLSSSLQVTPLLVPHRDEYSETVGFLISGSQKKVLFIPDIDKWSKWEVDITQLISEVDYAFLDGTFYRNGEIWGRDMSEIPHPFISESMNLFDTLPTSEKEKIHFIHLNHTNPLLNKTSEEYINFSKQDYQLAEEGQIIFL